MLFSLNKQRSKISLLIAHPRCFQKEINQVLHFKRETNCIPASTFPVIIFVTTKKKTTLPKHQVWAFTMSLILFHPVSGCRWDRLCGYLACLFYSEKVSEHPIESDSFPPHFHRNVINVKHWSQWCCFPAASPPVDCQVNVSSHDSLLSDCRRCFPADPFKCLIVSPYSCTTC